MLNQEVQYNTGAQTSYTQPVIFIKTRRNKLNNDVSQVEEADYEEAR